MKALLACILSLTFCAHAQQSKFIGEFILKAKSPTNSRQLEKEYTITVEGGTATIAYLEGGQEKKDKGTVTLTIHTGMDPSTKRFTEFTGFVRVELLKPGWGSDRFVTRFDLPFTAPPSETSPKASFAEDTLVEVLWLDILPDGLNRYSDPMNLRTRCLYSITVDKNPMP